MKADATLSLSGKSVTALVNLERGWQLIPAGVERKTGVKALIEGITGKVNSVWHYDNIKKS